MTTSITCSNSMLVVIIIIIIIIASFKCCGKFQIHEEARKFSYQTGVRVVVAYGGAPIKEQVLCLLLILSLLCKFCTLLVLQPDYGSLILAFYLLLSFLI